MTWKEAYGRPGGIGWFLPGPLFLLLRGFFFFLWLIINVYAIYQLVTVYDFPMKYYLTKLTSWSAILLVIYLGFAFYSTFMAQCSKWPDGKGKETPWFIAITWMLQTINVVIQPMVTLMYFALVHEWGAVRDFPRDDEAGSGDLGSGDGVGDVKYSFAIVFVGHALNSALAVGDLLITRNRLVLGHFVVAVLFALTYMIFTVVYYVAGGTNEDGVSPYIYPALDWSGFGNATIIDDCSSNSTVVSKYCKNLSTRVVATLLLLVGAPSMSLLCYFTFIVRRRLRRTLEQATGEPKTYVV